ncbi:MAG: response regulator [Chloroflexota bacterium]
MPFDEFVLQLADGYEHLYDLVYLRTHPLIPILVDTNGGTSKDHAWSLHHLLLDVIQELNPGNAPISSREWRRHRLLSLRYADGLPTQSVADQLAISRRHYYRSHEEAIRAIATILWNRYQERLGESAEVTPVENSAPVDRMELLRLEAAQMSRIEQQTNMPDVLQGVFTLLDEQVQRHKLKVRRKSSASVPSIAVDPRLMRQFLLALLSYLIEQADAGTLDCKLTGDHQSAQLLVSVSAAAPDTNPERLNALNELAVLCNLTIEPTHTDNGVTGFKVILPIAQTHKTILVIDDNDDILELIHRYLRGNYYEVATAKTAQIAFDLIDNIHPSAIILDLMMPDRDGWDLLQYFTHQPATQATPIIVCSVLRQKELALSLGAAAFIEKPISEQHLIDILARLIGPN